MRQQLFPAFRMTLVLTILTGLLYPGLVTGLCRVLFQEQASGSLIQKRGQTIGSKLIGQNFARPEYFHPRPSAAGSDGYDATASGGSNLAPTNKKLFDRVKLAAEQYRKDNPGYKGEIPADALAASASGLDPHISVANAQIQAERVAKARNRDLSSVLKMVAASVEDRDLGFLGEPRVNVLLLNLKMDEGRAM